MIRSQRKLFAFHSHITLEPSHSIFLLLVYSRVSLSQYLPEKRALILNVGDCISGIGTIVGSSLAVSSSPRLEDKTVYLEYASEYSGRSPITPCSDLCWDFRQRSNAVQAATDAKASRLAIASALGHEL